MQTHEAIDIAVPARAAALGWLNAFLAASQEEDRQALYRTLSVEFFPRGLHFVGCDGTALFRAWVPDVSTIPWPALDEEPLHAVVVMDPDAFGLGFMRALVRVTSDDLHEHDVLSVAVAPCDDSANLALGEEFMSERLTLRACGQRIDLRLFEGAYPNWRVLKLDTQDAERVEGMTISPRLFALVGKIKGAHAVDLEFHGEHRYVGFTARGATDAVRGLLMPMRNVEA